MQYKYSSLRCIPPLRFFLVFRISTRVACLSVTRMQRRSAAHRSATPASDRSLTDSGLHVPVAPVSLRMTDRPHSAPARPPRARSRPSGLRYRTLLPSVLSPSCLLPLPSVLSPARLLVLPHSSDTMIPTLLRFTRTTTPAITADKIPHLHPYTHPKFKRKKIIYVALILTYLKLSGDNDLHFAHHGCFIETARIGGT